MVNDWRIITYISGSRRVEDHVVAEIPWLFAKLQLSQGKIKQALHSYPLVMTDILVINEPEQHIN